MESRHFPIDPVKDAGEKQLYSHLNGMWGVRRMNWYIEQGDDLMRARPIEFDFFREYDVNPSHDDLQVTSVLLECESAKAPLHPRDELLKTNCTLTTDLSVVPKEYFEKKLRRDSDGKMIIWWELHFKLVVTIQSGPMLFSLKCRGKEYGAVTTKY